MTEIIPTNTLLITNNDDSILFSLEMSLVLQQELEKYGPLYEFIPLKSMSRYVVIYKNTNHSLQAKQALHNSMFSNIQLNVYFGQYFDVTGNETQFLRVPEINKNFLLSPPGSPPVDWTQQQEHSPVMGGFDAVLDEFTEFQLEPPHFTFPNSDLEENRRMDGENNEESLNSCRIVLNFGNVAPTLKSPDGSTESLSLPTIIVENIDGESLNNNLSGNALRAMIPKTGMPPKMFSIDS